MKNSKSKLQITKELLAKELAEMKDWKGRWRRYEDMPLHKQLTFITQAERFITAVNRIRRRHEDREKV